MKGRVAGFAAIVAAALGTVVTPAADAHQAAGAFTCQATLNLAAGSGHTACVGTATGFHGDSGVTSGSILADVDYVETGCPLVGEANGTVALDGVYFADLTYRRVGAAAAVVLSGGHTGAAVGVFEVAAADLGPNLCSDTDVSVTIQGAFAAA